MRKSRTIQRIPVPGLAAAWLGLGLSLVAGSVAPLSAQDFNARAGSSVTLGGRVQAQFEASGSDESKSSFFIRRAWITVDGRLNELVSGRLQFDANGNKVLEAYLAFTPSDRFRLELGQFKRAISTFWLAANFDLPLDRARRQGSRLGSVSRRRQRLLLRPFDGGLGLDAYEPGFS